LIEKILALALKGTPHRDAPANREEPIIWTLVISGGMGDRVKATYIYQSVWRRPMARFDALAFELENVFLEPLLA